MAIKIKTCPFCNGNALWTGSQIVCINDFCEIQPFTNAKGEDGWTKAKSIRVWNTRKG